MGIDFENKESRLDYLSSKLDDLLDSIHSSYGKTLLDELVTRLHRTIEDFNEEFQGIIGNLKDNSERRHQILHDLMEGKELAPKKATSSANNSVTDTSQEENPVSNTEEMSAWEKRLEGLE